MKRSFALVFAVACGLGAASALAQAPSPAAYPAGYEAYTYYDVAGIQQSPSDKGPIAQAPMAQAPIQAPGCGESIACDSSCNGCGCGWGFCWPCGCLLSDLGEPCKLWEPCCEDSGWVAGGWLAQSFTWNPYDPADRFNGPVTPTDRSNEYQMNELYGYIGKAANTEGCGWD